jgi:hypothetical protein
MANNDKLLESMEKLYERASRGELYPDSMAASESWFRFRMGDEAFDQAFQARRATYFSLEDIGIEEEE